MDEFFSVMMGQEWSYFCNISQMKKSCFCPSLYVGFEAQIRVKYNPRLVTSDLTCWAKLPSLLKTMSLLVCG